MVFGPVQQPGNAPNCTRAEPQGNPGQIPTKRGGPTNVLAVPLFHQGCWGVREISSESCLLFWTYYTDEGMYQVLASFAGWVPDVDILVGH